MAQASRLSSKYQVTAPRRVREALGLRPGDILSCEVKAGAAVLRRADPLDAAFHAALSGTLEEWASPEDEEAFRDL